MHKNLKWYGLGGALALFAVLFVVGCQGPIGPAGSSTGTVTGAVTNSVTGKPEAGVKVILDPAVKDANIVTDDKGAFTAQLPIGAYNATFQKANFTDSTLSLSVASGQTASKSVTLKATAPVVVSAGAAVTAAPGTSVTLKPTISALDGSTPTAYKWTQTAGPAASIDNPAVDTIKVTLPDVATFKTALIKALSLLDRVEVQAINPLALSAAQVETFKLTVTTSTGSYSGTVSVTADIPFAVSLGIADVPIGVPVLMNGKVAGPYSWSLSGPAGSKAALSDAASRNPSFTPDVVGKYILTEATTKATVPVYGGTWQGAITGQDAKGAPVAANCTGCHNGKTAPDNFTPWAQSGHAYIVSDNLNTSTHYSESCFACHTVGFNKSPAAVNNGVDDQSDYASFLAAGLLGKGIPTAWTTALTKFPKTASLMNIQCENCHGPNVGTGLHPDGILDAARIDISSDVCGSCHGKPPSHGKFQQWQNSAHGNFATAIAESGNTNCARCHTGQGFMAWLQQGGNDLTKPLQGKNGTATAAELAAIVTPDTAQPQTCVVCHDPHDVGTSNHATAAIADTNVRIEGDTPMLPSGYKATEVGKGAICITCHNTRNGLHNDSNPPTAYQAPHTAAQGDVLMGENAYFVNTPTRSPHASLEDSCVTCHMQDSPSPLQYSAAGAGANHGFTADIGMCSKCHSDALNGAALQAGYEAKIAVLGNALSASLLKRMPAQVNIMDYTPHTYSGKSYDLASATQSIDKANIVSITLAEPHGQQGYLLTFKTPVTFTYAPAGETPHTMTVTTAQFQLGSLSGDGGKTALVAFTDNIVKAGWNYFLVEADSSFGVHNPAFETAVIDASINALK